MIGNILRMSKVKMWILSNIWYSYFLFFLGGSAVHLKPLFKSCGFKGDFSVYGLNRKGGNAVQLSNKASRNQIKGVAAHKPLTHSLIHQSCGLNGHRLVKPISDTDASVTKPLAVGHEAVRSVMWGLKATLSGMWVDIWTCGVPE